MMTTQQPTYDNTVSLTTPQCRTSSSSDDVWDEKKDMLSRKDVLQHWIRNGPWQEICVMVPHNGYKYYRTVYENDLRNPLMTDYCVLTEKEMVENFDNPLVKNSNMLVKDHLYRFPLETYANDLGYTTKQSKVFEEVQHTMQHDPIACNNYIYNMLGRKKYLKLVEAMDKTSSFQKTKIHKYLFLKYLYIQDRAYNFAESANYKKIKHTNGKIFHIFYKTSLYG